MKVIERFTRTAAGEFNYVFAASNPSNHAQTWQGEMVFRTTKGPIYEFAYHEGNDALRAILLGARHAEASKPPAPAR